MSNECLVVKLKDSVSNSALPYLGKLKIKIKLSESQAASQANKPIVFEGKEKFHIKCVEGAYISDNASGTGIQEYNSYEASEGVWRLFCYCKAGEYTLIVDKYNITSITTGVFNGLGTGQESGFDIEDLKYTEELEYIDAKHSYESVYGDIANIAKSSLKWFSFNNCNGIYGELSSLNKCLLASSVYSLHFNNTKVTGSINTLAEAQIKNGRNVTSYPNITIVANELLQYESGTKTSHTTVNTTKNIVYVIVFIGSGNYEIRQDSATGTLLYTSAS